MKDFAETVANKGVKTDAEFCVQTFNSHPDDFTKGLFILHGMDLLIISVLYVFIHHWQSSLTIIITYVDRGPFFSDKAFLENYRRLLGNTTNAPIQTILRKSLSNAVRLLAFFAYYYSLGGVRFNNLQRYSIIYAVYYEKYPSAIQNAYIILQLAALILPANDVVWEMTRVFLYSLSQEPDGKKMPAVGQNPHTSDDTAHSTSWESSVYPFLSQTACR